MTANVTTDYRFAPIPEAVLYDERLSPLAVRVYGCLMRHGLDPAGCYPSQRRIGELIHQSARSIQRPLKELEEAGWIESVPRFDARGDRQSNGFHVRTAGSLGVPPAQESAYPPARVSAVPPAQESAMKESQLNESQLNETTTALSLLEPEPDSFDVFWQAYPRRTAKPAARTAWAKATKRASQFEIIAAAYRFAQDPNRVDQFTPHPATWLNQDRWNDGPLPSRTGRVGRQQEKDERSRSEMAKFLSDEEPKEIGR